MKTITAYIKSRLNYELKEAFKRACYQKGLDMSAVIRRLIKQWLICIETEGEIDYLSLKTAMIDLFRYNLFKYKSKDHNLFGLPADTDDNEVWDAVEHFNEVLKRLGIFEGYNR